MTTKKKIEDQLRQSGVDFSKEQITAAVRIMVGIEAQILEAAYESIDETAAEIVDSVDAYLIQAVKDSRLAVWIMQHSIELMRKQNPVAKNTKPSSAGAHKAAKVYRRNNAR